MEKLFLTAEEVAKLLAVSKSQAYKVIAQMNDEMQAQGYLTMRGRVSRQYLMDKIYGTDKSSA